MKDLSSNIGVEMNVLLQLYEVLGIREIELDSGSSCITSSSSLEDMVSSLNQGIGSESIETAVSCIQEVSSRRILSLSPSSGIYFKSTAAALIYTLQHNSVEVSLKSKASQILLFLLAVPGANAYGLNAFLVMTEINYVLHTMYTTTLRHASLGKGKKKSEASKDAVLEDDHDDDNCDEEEKGSSQRSVVPKTSTKAPSVPQTAISELLQSLLSYVER